jgi:hypothetical protein
MLDTAFFRMPNDTLSRGSMMLAVSYDTLSGGSMMLAVSYDTLSHGSMMLAVSYGTLSHGSMMLAVSYGTRSRRSMLVRLAVYRQDLGVIPYLEVSAGFRRPCLQSALRTVAGTLMS